MSFEVKNLCKAFGEHRLFQNLSFTCDEGMLLQAPSGWGKTTLMRILMGLEKADSGQVLGVGRVFPVFQEDRLIPRMNAVENIAVVCRGISTGKITETLERLEMTGEVLTLPAAKLSGGQKRRVALVRALLAGGDTLLLDEPFTGMDSIIQSKAIELLLEKRNGRAVLLATHDRVAAENLGWNTVQI